MRGLTLVSAAPFCIIGVVILVIRVAKLFRRTEPEQEIPDVLNPPGPRYL